jgi:inhibitor of cysteine peptidase
VIIFDQNASGQVVDLPVGQVAELRLPENPTTGFRWAVTSAASPACRLTDEDFQGAPGLPGRGGPHIWQLTAVAPGECNIQLTCRRGFAPDAPGNTVFALHVRVTENPTR